MAQYLCIWVGAYWFSATLISKRPPGSHVWFFGFRTLTLVWLWISTPNFSATILMYMNRSLLIFSAVNFKMVDGLACFQQRNSSLLWNFSFKFHVHVLCGCRQKPIDFQLFRFQNGCLAILNNVAPCYPLLWGGGILVDHWSTISN